MSHDSAALAEICRALFQHQVAAQQGCMAPPARLSELTARGMALVQRIENPDLSEITCALTPALLEALPDRALKHQLFADDFARIAPFCTPELLVIAHRKGVALRRCLRDILAQSTLDTALPTIAAQAPLTQEICDQTTSLLRAHNAPGVALVLQTQVARFPDEMIRAGGTFLASNHLEGLIALTLAGLDVQDDRLDIFSTQEFVKLRGWLVSAHGRMKLHQVAGSLPEFLAHSRTRMAAIQAACDASISS